MQRSPLSRRSVLALVGALVGGACVSSSPTVAPTTGGPSSAAQPAPTPQKMVLKATHNVAEASLYHKNFVQFKEAVEARTNGSLTIQVYSSESLVKARDTLDAVSKGIADFGFLSFAYWPGDLRFDSEAQMLPFSVSWETAARVHAAGKPIFQQEIGKFNQLLLFPQPLQAQLFLKKPLADPGNPSFRGLRVNGVGPLAQVIDLLGGAATSVPGSELPTALRTGVVDGTFTTVETYVNLDLVQDAPYFYDLGASAMFVGVWWSINEETWNRLPQAWQQIILEESEKAGAAYLIAAQESDRSDQARALAKGAKITKLAPDQLKVWRQMLQPYYESIIQKHGEPMRKWVETVDRITSGR
ncbi:MAG: TRAP transporter substrate-binding protein DctP [Dehalococcoidia bacterium]